MTIVIYKNTTLYILSSYFQNIAVDIVFSSDNSSTIKSIMIAHAFLVDRTKCKQYQLQKINDSSLKICYHSN